MNTHPIQTLQSILLTRQPRGSKLLNTCPLNCTQVYTAIVKHFQHEGVHAHVHTFNVTESTTRFCLIPAHIMQ